MECFPCFYRGQCCGIARTHDFDAQRARTPVQFFDAHKDAHGLRFQQNAFGNTRGKGFKQVQPFCRQFRRDGFGHTVIAEDAVNIVVNWAG